MKCQLFDAAGNKILWLEPSEPADGSNYDRLKVVGSELARRYQFGQEMTAVLFRSQCCYRALFWNPDGTHEMVCGNAIRCLAHFVASESAPLCVSVNTQFGNYVSRRLDVNRGSVVIPGCAVQVAAAQGSDLFVNAGTPHRIRFVDREWPGEDVRDAISCSGNGDPVNFNLLHEIGPYFYRVRIFERGVGETSSCGTAAVAIAAAVNTRTNGSTPPRTRHLVQFASGEQLTVTHDGSADWYEVSGNVTLLRILST
jgi:diaminopimelate epimerase